MADNDTLSAAELAFETGHFPYMAQALAMAMSRCAAWRFYENGAAYNAAELFGFAKPLDEKRTEDDPSFYMVSAEGAIGLSPGKEYLTQWIFLPMEEGPERTEVIARMKHQMDELEEKEKQEEQAAQAAQMQAPRFCSNCGAPLQEGAKFCTHCGTKI